MTEFRIADTFTAALARLDAPSQKAAKTTAFDLQLNPAAPGLRFHRIDARATGTSGPCARAPTSASSSTRRAGSLLLAYVDHHDAAYAWAERRRIEAHPTTGAIQIVEIRERVEDARPPRPRPRRASRPGAAADAVAALSAERSCWASACRPTGSPTCRRPRRTASSPSPSTCRPRRRRRCWTTPGPAGCAPAPLPSRSRPLRPSRRAAPLPRGGRPGGAGGGAGRAVGPLDRVPPPRAAGRGGPRLHRPGARHRLRRHRQDRGGAAPRRPPGPRRPCGPRAAHHLLRAARRGAGPARGGARRQRRRCRRRITVLPIRAVADELFQLAFGHRATPASDEQVQRRRGEGGRRGGDSGYPLRFILSEWRHVVDAWQIADLEAYARVPRLGRKSRMSAGQRERLWPVFAARARLARPARAADVAADLRGGHRPLRRPRRQTVRPCRRRRGAGPGRAGAAPARRHRARRAGRAVLRRRRRAAHLPAAVLLVGAGRRRARPLLDPDA